jgi:hypothetical protein
MRCNLPSNLSFPILRRAAVGVFGPARLAAAVATAAWLLAGWPTQLQATPVTLNYENGNGLAARATFDLLDGGNTLKIVLENTSDVPFGGMDGDAAMVLSSINFDLGDAVQILDGEVSLVTGSAVVMPMGGAWTPQATPNLNVEYGYSNAGIGNDPAPFSGAKHAVTSHSNGGNNVTTFDGATGLPGGLDYGLVAMSSTSFGMQEFVQHAVDIRLSLSQPLTDMSFLNKGSYVEFGSDHAYVPVPEPAAIALAALGLPFVLWRRGGRCVRRRC